MPYVQVVPVVDHAVRGLCAKPYPLHRKGCPNFNHKNGCPPGAPFVEDLIDLACPVYAVYNRFDLGAHVERMRAARPTWSKRQLECCLYWQPHARKLLESELGAFGVSVQRKDVQPSRLLRCPEANGVNLTATMAAAGITLEWPPTQYAYQIVLIGRAKQPSPEGPCPHPNPAS
jgi:predicted metal-binding protein